MAVTGVDLGPRHLGRPRGGIVSIAFSRVEDSFVQQIGCRAPRVGTRMPSKPHMAAALKEPSISQGVSVETVRVSPGCCGSISKWQLPSLENRGF